VNWWRHIRQEWTCRKGGQGSSWAVEPKSEVQSKHVSTKGCKRINNTAFPSTSYDAQSILIIIILLLLLSRVFRYWHLVPVWFTVLFWFSSNLPDATQCCSGWKPSSVLAIRSLEVWLTGCNSSWGEEWHGWRVLEEICVSVCLLPVVSLKLKIVQRRGANGTGI
jgi:hypothetical protein